METVELTGEVAVGGGGLRCAQPGRGSEDFDFFDSAHHAVVKRFVELVPVVESREGKHQREKGDGRCRTNNLVGKGNAASGLAVIGLKDKLRGDKREAAAKGGDKRITENGLSPVHSGRILALSRPFVNRKIV